MRRRGAKAVASSPGRAAPGAGSSLDVVIDLQSSHSDSALTALAALLGPELAAILSKTSRGLEA